MNSSIVFAFLTGLVGYNYWSFMSTSDSPTFQLVLGIICAASLAIALFTLIRMNIVFKTGYGQSDLLTNWSMGLFFGIIISALLVTNLRFDS